MVNLWWKKVNVNNHFPVTDGGPTCRVRDLGRLDTSDCVCFSSLRLVVDPFRGEGSAEWVEPQFAATGLDSEHVLHPTSVPHGTGEMRTWKRHGTVAVLPGWLTSVLGWGAWVGGFSLLCAAPIRQPPALHPPPGQWLGVQPVPSGEPDHLLFPPHHQVTSLPISS